VSGIEVINPSTEAVIASVPLRLAGRRRPGRRSGSARAGRGHFGQPSTWRSGISIPTLPEAASSHSEEFAQLIHCADGAARSPNPGPSRSNPIRSSTHNVKRRRVVSLREVRSSKFGRALVVKAAGRGRSGSGSLDVPTSMAVQKTVPASSAGCTVVLENPLPKLQIDSYLYAELLKTKAGVPPGVRQHHHS